MKVDIRLLGGFALALDGDAERAVRIRAPKGCALMAYLAMHPERWASRERLADLLWGDRFDDRARQNLRQCLVRLRADLGSHGAEALVLDQDGVGLRGDDLTVDALQFATLADSADMSRWKQAIELYRGEFLADFHLNVEGFDEWVRSERIRLAGIATRLYESVAECADQLGMGEAAVSAAEQLIAIDPLREDWQRLALRLYARHRGREAALAHAQSVTAQLKHELGTAPDAATSALIQEIRRGAIAARPTTVAKDLQPATDREATDQREAPPARRDEVTLAHAASVAADSMAGSPDRAAALLRSRFAWPIAGLAGVAVVILISLFAIRLFPGTVSPAARDGILPASAIDGTGLAAQGLYSIVVLPFTASADDAGAEQALAEELTDDLSNNLSRAGALRVISKETANLYRDRPIDVAAIGTELGVRYVVVGSVRNEGARLRINVELVDASTRVQAWTDRFERYKSEFPAAADEIAWAITRQLHIETVMAEARRLPSDRSNAPTVGELLANGWAIIYRHTVTGTTAGAEDCFRQVLQRDPETCLP